MISKFSNFTQTKKDTNYLLRGIQQFKTSTIFALRYGFLINSGLAMNIIMKFINSSCRPI